MWRGCRIREHIVYIEDEWSEFRFRHNGAVQERIAFTINRNDVVLLPGPKDVDLIAN